MIDPKLFTVEGLLSAMLYDRRGNVDPWRKDAEILPAYVAPSTDQGAKPECRVRLGRSFLRYSVGPVQGYFWDDYGDDFMNPEIALLALMSAPIPPDMIASRP